MDFRLRQVRTQLGLTQDALASRLGVSRVLISYLECGRKSPTLVFVSEIAQVLDVPAWVLVDWQADGPATAPHDRTRAALPCGSRAS
jgi:transcriptional regulator with XRE-family HTH domain